MKAVVPDVLLLAAGESIRMGSHKALLRFDERNTFLEQCLEVFVAFGCENIVVVINESLSKNIKEVQLKIPENVVVCINKKPSAGRFSSVLTGLQQLKCNKPLFIHNVDNPFVSLNVLALLSSSFKEHDYAVPVYEEMGGHPLLVSASLAAMLKNEEDISINLKTYLKAYQKQAVNVTDRRVLANINDENDYLKWF
ncbi:MAG: NTP transferase domain-containing protein [Bacteroidetes bacterium]|jgi:molybdenum cofactor cytidylyltransferase|nr:NTP transferase domain-containing protein [Bacteroidota bacterium]